MTLTIERTYYPNGTNGSLYCNGKKICATIELPMLDNRPHVSCIPEGNYELTRRYSRHLGWHLLVGGVKGRSLILIHAANDALKELQGCIAPVTILTGEGRGLLSRLALDKVMAFVPVNGTESISVKITAAKAADS